MHSYKMWIVTPALVLLFALTATQAATRKPLDRRPPTAKFWYAETRLIYSASASAGPVNSGQLFSTPVGGSATDDVSGVASVTVTFLPCEATDPLDSASKCTRVAAATLSPCASGCRYRATIYCKNSTRRSCEWTTFAPPYPGVYQAIAYAVDRARRTGRSAPVKLIVA